MQTCQQLGVSVRRYLGWEPRQWHHRLPGGVVRIDTEPEYDEWERLLWAAWQDWRDAHCDGCGEPLDECLYDETKPASEQPVYQGAHYRCLSCEAIETAQIRQSIVDQEWAEAHERESRVKPRAPRALRWFAQRLR